MKWIKLENGTKIFIKNTKNGVFKSCKTKLLWGITKGGEWIPVVKVVDKKVRNKCLEQ